MTLEIGRCIKLFGLKDGLIFFFRFEYWDPARYWVMEVLALREWCAWKGWECRDPACGHAHYRSPPRVKDYPIMRGDACEYCGEELAETHVHNPNCDEIPFYWKVCRNCEELLGLQEEMVMHGGLMTDFSSEEGRQMAEGLYRQSLAKIEEFEKRTGKKSAAYTFALTESGRVEVRNHGGKKK